MSAEKFAIKTKQPQLTALMDKVVAQQKLGHAYIFEGMRGAGQSDMATYLAATIFCENIDESPCGDCLHCQRILNSDFPDVERVRPDGNAIKIDQTRELKQSLSLSAMESNSKVFIIEEADLMTVSAANSLLKFLEEPNPGVYLFLLTTHRDAILPTIQSRTQMIHFPTLNNIQLQEALQNAGLKVNMARLMSEMINDIDYGLTLSEDEVFIQQLEVAIVWLENILKKDPRSFTMVTSDWVKITKDRQEAVRGLDIILFHLRDLIYLTLRNNSDYQENISLFFPQHQQRYEDILPITNLSAIVKATEVVNQTQKMIRSNVSVQAAYEYMVLAIWQK